MAAFTTLSLTQIAAALQYAKARLGSTTGDTAPSALTENAILGVATGGVIDDMYSISSALPLIDYSTGSAGVATSLSRSDHKHPTQINDTKGNGDTGYTWSADKLFDEFALKATLASPTFTGSILLGATANLTDFPNAKMVISTGDSGHTYAYPVGITGEAVSGTTNSATGVGGVCATNAAGDGRGICGVGKVLATGDTGTAYGGHFRSIDTHAGGENIAVYAKATNGASNYSFYGNNGALYNAEEISTPKVKLTPEGGVAVKMTNKSGSPITQGMIVEAYSATGGFRLAQIDSWMPIGVVYDLSIANDAEGWVVVSGIASVYYRAASTIGNVARVGVSADTNEVAGQAENDASPTNDAVHFREIGHPIETRGTPGLALTILHFN